MFWTYNNQSSTPPIEIIFAKQDITLVEVLEYESVLQELKTQKQILIEYISRQDILSELIGYIIEEPSSNLVETERYRLANLACEVLTTDIPRINEKISEKETLAKLFTFFEKDAPLNPLLASYVTRTLSLLISRNLDQNWYSYQYTCIRVLEQLKSTENSSELLLKHLGTSAVMDFMLKLLTEVEGDDMQNFLINWLESMNMIENIVALLHPTIDDDRQCNAAQLLCDIIRKLKSKELINKMNEPDKILNSLQKPEIIEKLLNEMLNQGEISENSITGGINILLALLETPTLDLPRAMYSNLDNTGSGDPILPSNLALPTIISTIIPFLPKFHDLLRNPPKKNPVKLACGVLDPPLGKTRLFVTKFIAALIATNNQEVNCMLDELNTFNVLLDLFFQFTWNNFLHSQVDKCLASALDNWESNPDNPLIPNIFVKSRLLQRILDAWQDNSADQEKVGGKRRGYMGYLTNIANTIVKQNLEPLLSQILEESVITSWADFVETKLKPINAIHNKFLGGLHPSQYNDSESRSDFIPNDTVQQDLNTSISYLENVDLDKDENAQEDIDKKTIFEDMCSLKLSQDASQIWVDLPNTCNNDDSSSDEDEKPGEDTVIDHMWNTGTAVPILDDSINPWVTEDANLSNDDGWADFSMANLASSFDEDFTIGVKADKMELKDEEMELKDEEMEIKDEKMEVKDEPKLKMNDLKEVEDEVAKTVEEMIEKEVLEIESDNNANLNSFQQENPDEKLIDNFRFLAKQGLISEKADVPNQSDEVLENDCVPQEAASGESSKPEVIKDPV